ncbi:MAG: glycosyltransferase family 4 protein, partial [Cytophagales bacterium]|nr:glycosyltransferase family 4 protein [Cytophagales bacterium]
VISRYTHWKGIQYTIPAFKELLKKYPEAVLVLANAQGEYANEIQHLLSELPNDSYREIRFESQLGALYSLFDVFVHVPIDEHSEAFGQVYVESLAAGVPSVFTRSGIANDFVQDGWNALEVPFQDSASIAVAIERILTDENLRTHLISHGKALAMERFGLNRMIDSLEKLYEK